MGMGRGIRISFAMAAAGCAAAAIAGCGSTHAPATASAVVMARGVAAVEPAADPRPLAEADTQFGLDVLREWCAQYPGQNLVFSPSTLASALGMAYLGARGDTASAMAKVLHLPSDDAAALAAGLQARSDALGKLDGPGVTVAASNQVWADPALTTSPGYLNSVATGYGAGVAKAPFSTDPAEAAQEINTAISAATRGHITNLVSPDMVAQVGWVLTSALYLDANWATPFDPAKTQPGSFTTAGGQSVTASYLNGDGFADATSDGWTGVSLPYAGGNLTMTALLPPADSAACALPGQSSLTAITSALADSGGSGQAAVSLPKVNLSVSGAQGDMRQVLTELGMGQAFTDAADFTGLSPEAGNLAFVQQAATLAVAEKGTVAAAAAAVGVLPAAAEVAGTTITFDRPYLMLISANATGEPLFLAEVDNPTAG
jgi:serine protease inhibitor